MVSYHPDKTSPDKTMQGRDFVARREEAAEVRNQQRDEAQGAFITDQPATNGDEARFDFLGHPGFGSFTKALCHDENGMVTETSFESLLSAVEAGTQDAFNNVILGGGKRLLANPLNAYSFQQIGNDSNGARMAAAPAFASRNTAVDMVERYWMALCRDIPFDQYGNSNLIAAACEDLNSLGFEQEFGFEVTPQTIFRGPYDGCDVGPHVSQFLLQDFQFGNQPITQMQRYPRPGLDYLTDLESWNRVNNGDIDPTGSDIIDGTRYITTLRDAGQWVHIDFPHQSGLWATIILLGLGINITSASPYASGAIKTAEPFGSLGGPDVTIQSGLAGVYGLKHAWFQKWCVHRRLRPEVYAQRLELFRRGVLGDMSDNPLNDALFNNLFGDGAPVWRQTAVLDRIFEHNRQQNVAQSRSCDGTWLLPMAFPEGSPTHPAYPGGHSVFIAAAATVAKAFFADGEYPCPKVPVDGGERLGDFRQPQPHYQPYQIGGCPTPKLTIHGELNKLIANITLFRDGAGMHWRTDGTAIAPTADIGCSEINVETGGNLLGEKLAISMLRDTKRTYREQVGTFQFQSISGNSI
ncbi:MAG: phosphatidic acid phosphatase [Elainellaceae cyanobacterium]